MGRDARKPANSLPASAPATSLLGLAAPPPAAAAVFFHPGEVASEAKSLSSHLLRETFRRELERSELAKKLLLACRKIVDGTWNGVNTETERAQPFPRVMSDDQIHLISAFSGKHVYERA